MIYRDQVSNRTQVKFLAGLYPRLKNYIVYSFNSWLAKKNGAMVGKYTTISYKLAKKANKNLIIGDHTVINTHLIDLKAPVKIGSNVIIGAEVEIITTSHNIDSEEWEFKSYGIEIENFSWIATKTCILPSCRKIGVGAVCGACSVVVKNVESMSVVSGNPARHIRHRKVYHSNLVVESLLGGDLVKYIEVKFGRDDKV